MTATEWVATLRLRGVAFAIVEGRLLFRAPKGALSDAEKQELAARRDELLRLLALPCLDCGAPALLTWPPQLAETPRLRCFECARAAWQRVYGVVPRFLEVSRD